MRRLLHDLYCLVTGRCLVFRGDEYTAWLRDQEAAARAANAALVERERQRERTNWWADDQFGGPPPPEPPHRGEAEGGTR